ncbi:MAG: hypothetical protein OMM_05144 [Candidatus Magnetoglobus multicellularis str. Araruama]|uniref:Uncharacterized protein n=1 Tax=Candidatus Magnetoglobus multicellularis str. Araruama TaxID=890399 RepID=A0A1V1NXY4_9BACT|nr:MAG: hypothetical protein OMM_05144 [Candidatus Magnetoglobus multicellularis str. Araruama]
MINIARNKVRDSLSEINSFSQSINGVTGNIFFNEQGAVDKPLKLAFYKKQKLFPCFQQYVLSHNNTSAKANKLITINNTVMQKTKIVYAGIDFKKLSDLDINQQTCEIEFYIWFRFENSFDPNEILFMNAVEPISFGDPFFSERTGKVTTLAYLLKGKFNVYYDRQWLPFDTHEIQIKFRHKYDNTDHIIFIPDHITPGDVIYSNLDGHEVKKFSLDQTIYENDQILDPTKNNNFAVINASTTIQRSDPFYFLRFLIPLTLCLISVLYILITIFRGKRGRSY